VASAPALWLGRVAVTAARAEAAGRGWLSPSERVRLDAISAPLRRAQFLAGRWVARALLAAVHGADPLNDWALTADPDLPPMLSGASPVGPLHVALSHSGDHVVCGIDTAPIGIDVEAPRRPRNAALMKASCCREEATELDALEEAVRQARFDALWTLKEAWLKQRCTGVSPARLATLCTRLAADGERPDAWCWRSRGVVLSVAAAAEPILRFDEAAHLAQPERWCVGESLTSP
jgi:4'-phosphopantetheinyl transferase